MPDWHSRNISPIGERRLETQKTQRKPKKPTPAFASDRWHDAVIAGESWRGTGLTAWQNGGSVEERAIEWLEKLKSQ